MNGPSPHLSWSELACRDGSPYPAEWRADRLARLAETFETIRADVGGPLIVNSAYRTTEYNRRIGGAKLSQHVMGRALDIRSLKLTPEQLHARIRRLYAAGKLPHLGGLGAYTRFVHIDVRPKSYGRLAVWSGNVE